MNTKTILENMEYACKIKVFARKRKKKHKYANDKVLHEINKMKSSFNLSSLVDFSTCILFSHFGNSTPFSHTILANSYIYIGHTSGPLTIWNFSALSYSME